MRLDKFLKVSRLIKRRTVAKEMCNKGRISVNGQIAKAGTNIKIDDEIAIQFGPKLVTVRVKAIKEMIRKEEAESMYTVVSEKKVEH
ncbi:RNA-binding S4 domain-containing protein [Pueribacillus sp. YX66]|uniref:RNA-binding S4 domain-containing protein n=1 Tax=Pueribacillus sp. YX66 TaxID=3229242 RepID=UPI00358CEDB0